MQSEIFRFQRVKDSELIRDTISPTETDSCTYYDWNKSGSDISECSISDQFNVLVKWTEYQSYKTEVSDLASLTIANCRGSTIHVDASVKAIHVCKVIDCVIKFEAVQGSVSVIEAIGCTFEGFCSQMRLTDSRDLCIRVQTNSLTALAQCRDVRVDHPPVPQLTLLKRVGLCDPVYISSDKWKCVKDFDSLSNSYANWKFI